MTDVAATGQSPSSEPPVGGTTDRPSIDPELGLSPAGAAERVQLGLSNEVPEVPSRTVAQIFRANIFTRFNLLMSILLAIVLACQSYKDALFGGVVIANTLVGIV
ncbi:MAG TPA: hypothetical protein VL068_05530, partial [Microthrixaceae bacterium]|nr:hypothetical protein [Microthrixaceae bacterium]